MSYPALLTIFALNLNQGAWNMIAFFKIFQHWECVCTWYDGCRKTCDIRNQGISSHGTGLVILAYFGFSDKRVNIGHNHNRIFPTTSWGCGKKMNTGYTDVISVSRSLKHNCCHFDKTFSTGCTRNCHLTTSGADKNSSKWRHFRYNAAEWYRPYSTNLPMRAQANIVI